MRHVVSIWMQLCTLLCVCNSCCYKSASGNEGLSIVYFSHTSTSSSSGTEIPLMVETYGLLNDIFPFPSILDTCYPIFKLHLANVLFDVFLCTCFHLHPLNRPVSFLCWESLASKVSHGWLVEPSNNPQPGGPGDFFSRFFSSSLYRSLCQPQGSGTGLGLPRVLNVPGTLHIWRAFSYPPPGEAPDGRPVTPHNSVTHHVLECRFHTLTEATDSGGICSIWHSLELII